MHPNPVYRGEARATNIRFAQEQGFGMLAVTVEGAPLLSHIPFLLDDAGALAEFHLVRSNPIARALDRPLPARLAIQGAHSYVSPDWYGMEDQVPTWNYVAVHLVGEVELAPPDSLRDLLDRQSAFYEERLRPKAPWRTDKMTPEVLDRMMRQIVPCRMRVGQIDGTWKLSQNKPDAARLAAGAEMDAHGMGAEVRILAALMQDAPGER